VYTPFRPGKFKSGAGQGQAMIMPHKAAAALFTYHLRDRQEICEANNTRASRAPI